MVREIERRFLVHAKRLPKLVRGQPIIQGYLSVDPVVRVRLKGKLSFITIKFGETFEREEYEFRIPNKEFLSLLKKCKYKIEKTRYKVKLKEKLWEVDVFQKKNDGLIIAEVELSSKREKIQKPLWLDREITNEPKYLNVNLAQKPFTSW